MPTSKESVIVQVSDTSPFSFAVQVGATLIVKNYKPSSSGRPNVRGRFTKSAYLLFNGLSKVGRLSDAAFKRIGADVPQECHVVEVEQEKNVLTVEFVL
jgi:hypothetical protein